MCNKQLHFAEFCLITIFFASMLCQILRIPAHWISHIVGHRFMTIFVHSCGYTVLCIPVCIRFCMFIHCVLHIPAFWIHSLVVHLISTSRCYMTIVAHSCWYTFFRFWTKYNCCAFMHNMCFLCIHIRLSSHTSCSSYFDNTSYETQTWINENSSSEHFPCIKVCYSKCTCWSFQLSTQIVDKSLAWFLCSVLCANEVSIHELYVA